MSRTRAELRFKVLAIITGGDVGQEPSGEDAAAIDRYIDDAIDELSAKNIVAIQDADDIPNDTFSNLAEYVANAAADEFGGKMDKEKKRYIENELRVISRQTPGYGPQEVEFF